MFDKKNYYMPLYFDDWIGGTYSMSSAARGVYIMLVIALAKGERVHASIDTLRRLGGELNEEQYTEVIEKCKVVNGFLLNSKVDRVMETIRAKQNAGRIGGSSQRSQAELKQNPKQNPKQTTEQNASKVPSRTPSILNPNILNPKAESVNPKAQISDSLEPRTKRARRQVVGITWDPVSGWQNVTDSHKITWRVAYPNCSVETSLARMHMWLIANPSKAHKTNWLRFVTNWFARTREDGGNLPPVQRPTESNF